MDKQSRFVAIDAMRGIAALLVVFYHLFGNLNGYKTHVYEWMPAILGTFFSNGHLGVPIFFIISGYVISYSIGTGTVDFRFALNFALRRAIRLDPPYWVTISIAMSFTYVSYHLFPDIGVRDLPSFQKLIAHTLYLQDLLGYGNIVPVFWTLCLEFQFYIVFMLTTLIGQYLIRRQSKFFNFPCLIILYLMGIWSVAINIGITQNPIHGLFLSHWLLFFLGVLLRWSTRDNLSHKWFWSFFALASFEAYIKVDENILIGLATALLFYYLDWKGSLSTALKQVPLQYLGKISYSLYLIHPVIGWDTISVGRKFLGPELNVFEAILLFILGTGISIFAAQMMYICFERPSVNLARRLKIRPSRNFSTAVSE